MRKNRRKVCQDTVGSSRRPTRLAYLRRKAKIQEVNCPPSSSGSTAIRLRSSSNLSLRRIRFSSRMLPTTKLIARYARGRRSLSIIWILRMRTSPNLIRDIAITLQTTCPSWHLVRNYQSSSNGYWSAKVMITTLPMVDHQRQASFLEVSAFQKAMRESTKIWIVLLACQLPR